MNIRRATAHHPVYTSLIFMAAVFGLMALLVFLTGCTDKNVAAYSEEEGPAAVSEQTPPQPDLLRHSFDEFHRYDDGISIQVSGPQEFELSETGEVEGTERATAVMFEITIDNATSESFVPDAYPTVTTGEFEASLIKDVNNPFGDFTYSLPSEIPAGESFSWMTAYSVDSLENLTVKIGPSFDHDDARFTNVLP